MDGLLEPLGDGQVMRFYDVAAVGPGLRLPDKQQVVDFPVDEVLVAPQIIFVYVQARGRPKETLEFAYPHQCHTASSWPVGLFARASSLPPLARRDPQERTLLRSAFPVIPSGRSLVAPRGRPLRP